MPSAPHQRPITSKSLGGFLEHELSIPHPDLSLSQRGMLEAGCLVSSLGEHPDTSIQDLMEGGVSLAKQHHPPTSLLNFQIFQGGKYCS